LQLLSIRRLLLRDACGSSLGILLRPPIRLLKDLSIPMSPHCIDCQVFIIDGFIREGFSPLRAQGPFVRYCVDRYLACRLELLAAVPSVKCWGSYRRVFSQVNPVPPSVRRGERGALVNRVSFSPLRSQGVHTQGPRGLFFSSPPLGLSTFPRNE